MNETFVTVQGHVATTLRSGLGRGGTPYASFRVASTVRRQTESGWQDVATSFYSVSCYRALAEHVVASLQIGQPVVVYGRQVVRQWEKDEQKGTDVDIDAFTVGHDLTRGTSVFVKHGRRRPADVEEDREPGGVAAGEPMPAREDADGEAVASAAA